MTDQTTQLSIIEKMAFALIRQCFNLLGLVSRRNACRISNFLGQWLYRLDRKHRTIALDNLARAFGGEKTPSEISTIARKVFANLFRILFEIGWLVRLDPRDVRRQVKISGWQNFSKTLRTGKGALVLLAHAGNWELLAAMPPMVGVPVNVLYRPLDFKPLNLFFKSIRSRFGTRLVSTRRSARQVLRALGRGEIVGVLMDQNVDWYEGVFAQFFGRRAATNKGFALLALKTGAPVIPVFMIREEDGFRVDIWPEIPLIKTGDRTKDVERNTQQYNDVIERFVRRYPEQWFWVHQRWKTRPYSPWPRQK
jgi:Kdo2-lipid IVA lauroyltransferase/acyltransferase